jgi:Flp pilus assembly protein CpaB
MSSIPARPPVRRAPLRLRRRPVPYWVTASAVAVGTAALVGHIAAGAAEARDRWGTLRPAVVVIHDVGAGEPVDAEVRMLPRALVPRSALTSVPARAIALTGLEAGETLLATRLAGTRGSAVAARLPRGTRGVAVPVGSGLPLTVGDHVDVLATFDEASASDGAPTFIVAKGALVVHVGHDAVTVAVTERAAPRVAYALAAGAVELVLNGTSSRR